MHSRVIVLMCNTKCVLLQVGVSFRREQAAPGDQVSVVATASPNSVVVLGVIDKSLTLLADACKSVDKNNVSISDHEHCLLLPLPVV